MADGIKVRDVARSDFGEWLPLWDGYNAFYGRIGPTALPKDVTAMTWSRFFDADEPVHCLVAEANSRLVGVVHYIFHRSTTMIAPTCYLQDLFTAEEARGLGIGRALITGVYEKARQAGASRVYWQTHETNIAARKLYDRVADRPGFILYRKDL